MKLKVGGERERVRVRECERKGERRDLREKEKESDRV